MRGAQNGVALIAGLLVLLLMTLLALIVMVRTSTELMMAASEQYRRRASQSASAAIEDGIARIGSVPAFKGVAITRGPAALVDGSLERYTSTSTFLGTEEIQMDQLARQPKCLSSFSQTSIVSSVPRMASRSSIGSSPSRSASGVAIPYVLGSSTGGVRKNPIGTRKAREKAKRSSAVNWRIRPPSTERSMAEKFATDHLVPR